MSFCLVRQMPRRGALFRSRLGVVLCATGRQHVEHPVVPFVTRIFEHRFCITLHRDAGGKRPCKGLWVVDRKLIEKCVLVNAGKPLDETEGIAGAEGGYDRRLETRSLVAKVRGLDDQRVIGPVATRVT